MEASRAGSSRTANSAAPRYCSPRRSECVGRDVHGDPAHRL